MREEIPIRMDTVKDVRTLRTCGSCGGLGNADAMIHRKVPLDGAVTVLRDEYLHGRCFVKRYGRAELVHLPREQTDKLTLGDLGVRTMKYLIDYKTR